MLIKIKTKKTKNKVEALTLQKKSRCFITQTSPCPKFRPFQNSNLKRAIDKERNGIGVRKHKGFLQTEENHRHQKIFQKISDSRRGPITGPHIPRRKTRPRRSI